MAHLTTVATIGGLALVGTAIGLHLGNASVGEINPMYFQEPPTRFHSDLSAYRSPTAGVYSASLDTGSPLELGTGCVGCRTFPEEYYPERDPLVDEVIEGYPSNGGAVQLAVAEAPADSGLMRRQADLDRLQRYASYAVTAEEEQAQTVAEPAPAADEATSIQGDEIALEQ